MRGRNAKLHAGLVVCLIFCGCQDKRRDSTRSLRRLDLEALAASGPEATPAATASSPAARKSLDVAMKPFSLGTPACAGNLAVVPILTSAIGKTGGDYLTLAEALEKQLVTVSELEGGGSVPTLEMTSSAPRPVLIPFGAIVTGGKQDRMIKDDVVLAPGEKRKVAVYCIEQGRWSADGDLRQWTLTAYPGRVTSGEWSVPQTSTVTVNDGSPAAPEQDRAAKNADGKTFASNAYRGSNVLLIGSNVGWPQDKIWADVSSQNHAMGNHTVTANFQGNFQTKAFKESSAELAPVSKAIEAQANVAGAVAIVNGKVTGAEICASPEYFRKLWPQLFNGYVVDASAAKEKEKVQPAKAAETARAYMAAIESAKVETKQKEPQLRISIEAKDALGGATIEPDSGRLVYLRFFPRPKAGPARSASRGHGGTGQNVLFISGGGNVQWNVNLPAGYEPSADQAGGNAREGRPAGNPSAPGR
ncbi:MAG: ARPP-1 family domain-containing protein [Planctomycetota bacterium]|jgi:hypothetical protein